VAVCDYKALRALNISNPCVIIINKIPRSLRIKCRLTASPPYSSNTKFIKLKEEMDNALTTFIKKGKEIMIEWLQTNTELPLEDRCSCILTKALPILDCLTASHTELFGAPNWPSASKNSLTLFLLKLYLSNICIAILDIINYFNLPINSILLMGSKFLCNTNADEIASNKLDALLVSDINTSDESQHRFIFKTLTQFDQILRITTVNLWSFHKEEEKQNMAVNNIKSKMDAFKTFKATEATETFTDAQTQNLQTKLQISNLEKSFSKQEQKTNELLNILKKQQ